MRNFLLRIYINYNFSINPASCDIKSHNMLREESIIKNVFFFFVLPQGC